MDRVLVTGATGFMGRAVVAGFTGGTYAVRAAVRHQPQPAFAADVEVVQHPDLAESVDWTPLLKGVDWVIHLAGIAHAPRTDAALYDRVNHLATAQLAAAAARAGVRRLVFVSSIAAQSGAAADRPLTERDPAQPVNPYGRSKLAAEQSLRAAGVPFTILRPTLLYGPGAKGAFALLWRAAASPWPLPLKSFHNRRSLLGIGNFISAVAFVLSSPATIGETYVLADPGLPPSLAEVVRTLRQAQRRAPMLLPLPPQCVEIPLRLLGRRSLWNRIGGSLLVDPAKLLAAGWQPAHDTQTGLIKMAQGQGLT